MKIAMIGQRGLPASYGGVERHVEEIGARLAAEGHEVVVFCRKGYSDEAMSTYLGMNLVHQRTVDSKHLESFVASVSATLATLGRGYDVIHYHAVGPGLFTPLARVFTGARVVQTIHGLDSERAKWGRGASQLLRLGTWLSAKVPHATIVVSQSLQDAYRDRYRREAVHIVNGTPEPRPRPACKITERWGLTAGSYVLAVGRLVPEKAPELLLQAFAHVRGDVRLVIAGGSSHTDEYVGWLQHLAAADPRVLLAGYVYGEELEELYSNAALFVLPSLLEGLPLTLLEAISYGRSVVASDIPPHVEVLGANGPGARLVPVGDIDALSKSINEALHAPLEEEQAGAAALSERVCATYTWHRAAGDTGALYERLASDEKTTSRATSPEPGMTAHTEAADHRPRVLLVTGFGRSGTTLVNTILGSTPGVFAAGEIRFLWERGLIEHRQCGCGQTVDRCPVWAPVLEKAFGTPPDLDPVALAAEDRRVMRTRHLPLMLASRAVGDRLFSRLDALPEALTAVYRSVQEVTGARLIVDTSKPPSFGYVLQHLDRIDLRVLHVVRDPRAVAFSWTRSKPLTDGAARPAMARLSPFESALQWDLWNSAAALMWRGSDRYLRLRYEDLVADPHGAVGRVLSFAGVADLVPPFTSPRVLAAATVHTVAGNADRMRSGPMEIRADDAWQRELPTRSRRLVTALTLPLAVRYGYRASPDRVQSSR